jgi:uncharacterized protein (TIGR00369 family)
MSTDEHQPIPNLEDTSAFLSTAGLRFTHVGPDRVEGVIDLGPQHHTPWGVVHGGVYTTAIESAASIGASAAVADQNQFAVGVNNNTDFLRSMTTGRVYLIARPVQQGRTQQLWEVRISDENDRLVARGTLRLHNTQSRR